jgi:hypothetical protein
MYFWVVGVSFIDFLSVFTEIKEHKRDKVKTIRPAKRRPRSGERPTSRRLCCQYVHGTMAALIHGGPMSSASGPSHSPSALRAVGAAAAFQQEMRYAYLGGGLGMLVSGSVWLVAALVALWDSPQRAIWTLFAGGVLIHPVSVLLTRALGRPARHGAANPFGALALASTVWMILMLALAYGVALLRMDLFFPAMLFVIGGRYLTFATIYGARIYYACGAALALAGYVLASMGAAPALGAFLGAAIEAVFAAVILAGAYKDALLVNT